ncbi:hypothetical protein M0804_005624 [Polistes exclamans]|nr:hypothetical protein M0804_005624 [Polistes exclamans]
MKEKKMWIGEIRVKIPNLESLQHRWLELVSKSLKYINIDEKEQRSCFLKQQSPRDKTMENSILLSL